MKTSRRDVKAAALFLTLTFETFDQSYNMTNKDKDDDNDEYKDNDNDNDKYNDK